MEELKNQDFGLSKLKDEIEGMKSLGGLQSQLEEMKQGVRQELSGISGDGAISDLR